MCVMNYDKMYIYIYALSRHFYPKRLTIQAIQIVLVCSSLDELSLRGIYDSKVSALLEAGFTLPVCVEVSETLLQSIHFPFHL